MAAWPTTVVNQLGSLWRRVRRKQGEVRPPFWGVEGGGKPNFPLCGRPWVPLNDGGHPGVGGGRPASGSGGERRLGAIARWRPGRGGCPRGSGRIARPLFAQARYAVYVSRSGRPKGADPSDLITPQGREGPLLALLSNEEFPQRLGTTSCQASFWQEQPLLANQLHIN